MTIRRVSLPRWHHMIAVMDRECFPDDATLDPLGAQWWVVFHAGTPVAYAGLRVYDESVYLCRAGVMPMARGRGLHRKLIQRRLSWAAEHHAGKPVVTYTVPDNVASANNLIRCGFLLYAPDDAWAGRGVLYWRRAA